MWICDRNIYHTQEGYFVEEGDPRAVDLAFSKGTALAKEPKVYQANELTAKAAKLAEDKAVAPQEDKAVKPKATKKRAKGGKK